MNLDSKGLATRRAVLGDAYVDSALSQSGNAWRTSIVGRRPRAAIGERRFTSRPTELGQACDCRRHSAGGLPTNRLNARANEASDW